jgi:putative tryptophan/tyrosine transport system substrate-binding protein
MKIAVMTRRPLAVAALLACGAFLLLPTALAQAQARMRHIAFTNLGPEKGNLANVAAFREGLRELGYVEGRDVVIDYFWADNKVDRLPALVSDMLATRPDVILSSGGPPTIRAVKQGTDSVPVVFITADPVAENLVASLARPGGNLTGLAVLHPRTDAKRVELLHDLLPNARSAAVLWNPDTPLSIPARDASVIAASRAGVTLEWYVARNESEFKAALTAIAARRFDALLVMSDPVIGFWRKEIVEFASANRIPGVYFWREFVQDGGLISYGPTLTAFYRRAAAYIDRIFKGAKPADLPVELPVTFELVVNLRTAKALGIVFPKSVLVAADVVE